METNNQQTHIPKTQGIKYAGSKLKLLPHILELCRETKAGSVFDGFSGSTRVSQALAYTGMTVHSNDISCWSKPFAVCFLQNPEPRQTFQPLIDELNALKPIDGWFTQHYGGALNDTKKPWQIHNTRKLDAIREAIDTMRLDELSRAVALTSLMLALDEVDSTLGHHASYLRLWSKRSFQTLNLRVPNYQPQENAIRNTVSEKHVFEAAPETNSELAYYDPPYGSNNEKMPPSRIRYAAYYHLWTTVCLNDKPALFGKAMRRQDSSDLQASSVFEDFRKDQNGQFKAIAAIDHLLHITPCQWILLSYSSGGRATAQQLRDCLLSHGSIVKNVSIDYRRHIMATMQNNGEWLRDTDTPNQEFLFLLRKK